MLLAVSPFLLSGDSVRTEPEAPLPDMPFKVYQGYVVVLEGTLGNLPHQNLLLDTGTSPSMIDKSVADKLGLRGASQPLTLFNKTVAAQGVVLPSLQFGPVIRRNAMVIVSDFSNVAANIGTHIDAVIGLDLLGSTNFTLDFEKQRLRFRSSRERFTAPFVAKQNLITVDMKTGGRQLHLLFDTGTPRLVLFKDSLRQLDYERTALVGSGRNLSGTVPFEMILLSQARFGTQDVGPQRASVVDTQQRVENDYDGLIGISCLHPKRLSFDFERQSLAWTN